MIEIVIITVSLYVGYRMFSKPGEKFFYDD